MYKYIDHNMHLQSDLDSLYETHNVDAESVCCGHYA